MAELQAIIDAIVTLQKAITPPTGQKAIKNAWDEPPGDIGAAAFPCVVNLEEPGESRDHAQGHPEVLHTIGMHLLFSSASGKYSVRARRAWLEKFLSTFTIGGNTLSGTVRTVRSLEFDYSPFAWNNTDYAGINFTMEVISDR